LITTALVTLTAKAYIPLWFCVLIIGRDVALVIGILRLVVSGVSVKIRPPLTGKLAVTAQNLTLLAAMLLPTYSWASHILPTMLWIATFATVVSSVSYAKAFAAYRGRQAAQSS
jgi:phosphatidylglycerophosphate synthase